MNRWSKYEFKGYGDIDLQERGGDHITNIVSVGADGLLDKCSNDRASYELMTIQLR